MLPSFECRFRIFQILAPSRASDLFFFLHSSIRPLILPNLILFAPFAQTPSHNGAWATKTYPFSSGPPSREKCFRDHPRRQGIQYTSWNINPTHTSLNQARIAEVDITKGPPPPLRDNFGRMHDYLRISACLSQVHVHSLGGS